MQSKVVKRTLLAALVGGGVLAASAWAMHGGPAVGQKGCEMRHGQAMQSGWEDRRAARLGELKEKLKLAPGQQAAWQAFVDSAPRGPVQADADRAAMRDAFAKMTAPQRMDAMLEKAEARRAHLVARAEAVKAFYATLTPEQQAVFDAEAMSQRGHGKGPGHHGHMRHQS